MIDCKKYMRKITIAPTSLFLLLALTLLPGCATFTTLNHIVNGSPIFYSGTRLDIAALQQDEHNLAKFSRFAIAPPRYPLPDLPFSFAFDTAALPLVAMYELMFWNHVPPKAAMQ
jgi:uncharacterized protein YceK